MSTFRVWLFRGLVIAAAALMVVSWLLPWWGSWAEQLGKADVVRIYPYGLWQNLGGWSGFIKDMAAMPGYFTPLMWAYLGLCLAALAFSLWKMNTNIRLFGKNVNLSRLIIAIVGFSYVAIIVGFYLYASWRVESAGINWLGKSYVVMEITAKAYVHAGYRIGLWLACAVGPLLMLLALLRNKITGKPKTIGTGA